jgi:serine protease Do
VIGVNSAINPAGQGIGFAIPSDALRDVLPQLLEKGHVARGRIGVQIQGVDDAMAKALGMDHAKGALVGDVEANSAGAKAGIKPGDVIVRFDGKEVTHAQDLPRIVARHAPGTVAKIEVIRDKTPRTLDIKLDELKDDVKANAADEPKTNDATKSDGMFGVELGNSADGVVVRDVRPGSPAEGALETGDVILEVGQKPVKSADDAAKAFRSTRRSDALLLRVKRNGVSRFVVLEARSVLGRREPDE